MRVISGSRKGLKLERFDHVELRPTKDSVKESIFNCLANYLNFSGAKVADLFSGTGNLGIESLSRGAALAVFVEKDVQAVQIIDRNLRKSGFAHASKVVSSDVFDYLNANRDTFDVVFADPPYRLQQDARLLEALYANRILTAGGFVVLENNSQDEVHQAPGQLDLIKVRKWGKSRFAIYRNIT